MKSQFAALLISGMCIFGTTACTVQGGVVSDRPGDIVDVRGVAPGPDWIWIDGDWVWSGGSYHWNAGHWGRPRGGRAWHAGNWESHGKGYRWHRGYWK
jgi:hypothetical protein